ncbi:uncharacterized protein BO97DRAFT_124935 [Aspergillus homomorphus CBS 101889]|uniref:Uncharacterized protein n=1 Tax=Aspergillus homomorphus (strain CBS 101889) TaxID=1450537 RepID=A0A395HS77_ASPHC|nr:hypothetical protein BO97DRAFT_124935 [Aspergillus homomorphus CBS 101889]RAL10396.1 hypothetical protein BO97DRAFT_124935 [Aspergillus homomorphus CBS 101889]
MYSISLDRLLRSSSDMPVKPQQHPISDGLNLSLNQSYHTWSSTGSGSITALVLGLSLPCHSSTTKSDIHPVPQGFDFCHTASSSSSSSSSSSLSSHFSEVIHYVNSGA